MSSSISDALSTLSDRGLRRLLGARTFLRGLDYEKRRAVDGVEISEISASGEVKGSDEVPYRVTIQLGSDGITSECSCPAFQQASGQHCKHVAALIISVRNRARSKQPKRETPAAPPPPPPPEPKGARRRERRRRLPTPQQSVPPGVQAPPSPDATARMTGIGAWLSKDAMLRDVGVEFRVHVRQGGLTVTALDTQYRTALLPSALLSWLSVKPSADRAPLRLLARFESGNPRHPAVDVRGEDAAELLPLLKGRRVLLEPALMQLRFEEEPLQPRVDLEMVGAETIVAKATFERPTGGRRYQLTLGGWFEGFPSWHIDTSQGVAMPVDTRVSPAALRRLLRSPTIAEPASELISLIAQGLPKMALEMGAALPDLSQVADVVDLEPHFAVQAQGDLLRAEVALDVTYGATRLRLRADGISPPIFFEPAVEGRLRPRCVRCDIPAQQSAVEQLLDLGLTPNEDGGAFEAKGEGAIQFWSRGVAELPKNWEVFVPEGLSGATVRGAPVLMTARVSSGVDWLAVKVDYAVDGIALDRDELARCLATGGKYIRLSDNSYARFDPASVEAMLEREVELMTASKGGKVPLAQAGRIQELLEQVDSAVVSASAKALFEKLRSLDEIKPLKKPRLLKATLRPYQEQGFAWLNFVHELGSGGVLADDMGLGKTIQTLALLLHLKATEKSVRALIVAPTSVVTNWVREIARFAPTLKTALWHGAGRREQMAELDTADVIITSYALLRRDIDLLKRLQLDYSILDEAQAIKNPVSATAQAARELSAKHRLALTGTPIENRLSEIWSIFEYVSPGLLGTLPKFEERFARPIDQGDSKKAAQLRAVIHPFILRRTKTEVAKDLPAKIESDMLVDLPADQKALYTQVLREVRAQVMGEVERAGVAKAQLHILAGLTKLRQAACDPRLLGLPRDFDHDDSGKLAAVRELIEECEAGGHKVLVFSQFVSMLKLIREALDLDGVKYEYLDGSTVDRAERVDRFQMDPTISVFLISLKAGGSGLNLTAADTVVHFDPWWNPAVEEQASDRAHRIGQSRVVTVYRLIAAGTIEEKILQLKAKKKELVASVLSEDAGGGKSLTRADLDELFQLE